MASISGIAHIQLSVRCMEPSAPFYKTLLHSKLAPHGGRYAL